MQIKLHLEVGKRKKSKKIDLFFPIVVLESRRLDTSEIRSIWDKK